MKNYYYINYKVFNAVVAKSDSHCDWSEPNDVILRFTSIYNHPNSYLMYD